MEDESVNGLFSIASFDILLEFLRAQVSPYEPTRNPFKENCDHMLDTEFSKEFTKLKCN